MSNVSVDALLSGQMRADLAQLANGIAPLQRWIEQKRYNPMEDPTFADTKMPWREPGKTLTPADVGVIEFFEGLLRETSGDVQLKAEWERVAANPLSRSPFERPERWRAERGLSEVPRFGIVQAHNVLADSRGRQLARIQFYRDTLPDFAYCLTRERPHNSEGWEKLAQRLLQDQVGHWPSTVHPASVFISQYASDVMYALLGMRNYSPHPEQPEYAYAVLTEMAQPRRRGRKNTPGQAAAAVKRFQEQLRKDLSKDDNHGKR
jgi:hypothetical protein